MTKLVDFEALRRVFDTPAKPSANADSFVIYNGENTPRWLARDLMQERAAIMEYDGGMTRAEAQKRVHIMFGEL